MVGVSSIRRMRRTLDTRNDYAHGAGGGPAPEEYLYDSLMIDFAARARDALAANYPLEAEPAR